jgi:hypothetical protein
MTAQEMTADTRATLIGTIVGAIAPYHRMAGAAADPILNDILALEFSLMDPDTLAALAASLK